MVKIRIRHRAPLVDAKITYKDSGELSLRLKDEQRAVTPGQSVVIYHNDICMGGGIVI
jgi:tRNA-specific 2-thiouridylase